MRAFGRRPSFTTKQASNLRRTRAAGSGGLAACDDYRLALTLIRGRIYGASNVRATVCKPARPMEVTVKLRLLLTSALFLLAQMPTMQAQETLDLAKITCEQFMMEK